MKLRTLRKAAGMRQSDLAKALSVSQNTLSQWETEVRFPDLPTLCRIADYFGISLDTLVGHRYGEEAREIIRVPIYESLSSFPDACDRESILGYEYIKDRAEYADLYAAMLAPDDSLKPDIRKGDILMLVCDDTIRSDRLYAVSVGGRNAEIRRLIRREDGILLREERNLPALFYSEAEIQGLPVRVIGRVAEIRRRIKE